MEYLMSLDLNWADWLVVSCVVLYGYAWGVNNTMNRIITTFTGKEVSQNTFDKWLDFVWYVVITLTVLDMVTGA